MNDVSYRNDSKYQHIIAKGILSIPFQSNIKEINNFYYLTKKEKEKYLKYFLSHIHTIENNLGGFVNLDFHSFYENSHINVILNLKATIISFVKDLNKENIDKLDKELDAALHKILLNIYIWSKDITRKTIHHDILYDFSLLIDEIKEVDEQDTNIELLLSLSKILIESNLFGDYLYSSLPKHKKDIIHKNLGDLLIGKV